MYLHKIVLVANTVHVFLLLSNLSKFNQYFLIFILLLFIIKFPTMKQLLLFLTKFLCNTKFKSRLEGLNRQQIKHFKDIDQYPKKIFFHYEGKKKIMSIMSS